MDSIRITSLELENVKRVRAVAIEPRAEGLTVIGGRNAQGKTSVLDGIAYALGGEKYRPSALQNAEGMAPARMEVKLSNGLVVTRGGEKAALRVRDPEGRRAGQKLLDSFIGELAIDLPKFLAAPGARKTELLLGALGCRDEVAALDAEEKRLYDERTLCGREADRKAKYAAELPEYPDAPEEPLSASDMTRRLQEALAQNAHNAELRHNLQKLKDECAYRERELMDARRKLAEAETAYQKAEDEMAAAVHVQIPDDVDTAAMDAELADIEATNAKVRANLEKANAMDLAQQAKAEYSALTAQIEQVRSDRKALLDKHFPKDVNGLGIEDGELTYKGRKWDCMSTMEQMRAGVAVSHLVKPCCGFVLIDHLEAFDPVELREFDRWLAVYGIQAIATRVATDDTCDIIIEDGIVAGAEPGVPTAPNPQKETDKEIDW